MNNPSTSSGSETKQDNASLHHLGPQLIHPAATKKPINSTDMGRWTQTTLENFSNFNKHVKKLSEMKPKKSDLGRWTQTQLGFSPG